MADSAIQGPRGTIAVGGLAIGLMIVAVVLYSTSVSRAVGLVVLAIGSCLLGAAMFARSRGQWPSLAWRVGFLILVAAAAAYGIWLAIYASQQVPVSV